MGDEWGKAARIGQVGALAGIAAAEAAATGATPAVAGTAAVAVLAGGVTDYLARQLSKRQRSRVETVAGLTERRIRSVIESGEGQLRADGFFDDQPDGRNWGREATEGVLTVARDSYEERKLPFLANLMTAIAVCDWISPEFANRLIKTSEDISWNQYVLLAGIGRKETIPIPDGVEIGTNEKSWSSWTVHSDLNDLWWQRSLISGGSKQTAWSGTTVPSSSLNKFDLTSGGRAMFQFLKLREMPEADISRVWQLLLQDDTGRYPDSGS